MSVLLFLLNKRKINYHAGCVVQKNYGLSEFILKKRIKIGFNLAPIIKAVQIHPHKLRIESALRSYSAVRILLPISWCVPAEVGTLPKIVNPGVHIYICSRNTNQLYFSSAPTINISQRSSSLRCEFHICHAYDQKV